MTEVLVVEDDAAIRNLVAAALVDQGYVVTAVADGQEALDRCRVVRPDVVLLDLMMPVLDGFQFLKRRRCNAPVVVMSAGYRMREVTPEMRVAAFIAKPFDLTDLLETVERCGGPPLRTAPA